jgi:transposase-like protein
MTITTPILFSLLFTASTVGDAAEEAKPPECHDATVRAKLHSTNPIERLNGEIKRRIEVVGIFPNEAAITRLIGAILMEQSAEWAVQRGCHMSLETMAPVSDNPIVMLSAVAGT